jgi:hypothetical protein
LRVSRALNYSGVSIPFTAKWTVSGSDGKWYFFRVIDLERFLRSRFGPPDIEKPRPARPLDFLGKKGIILFDTRGTWSDATGHSDLWDRATCVKDCYFSQSTDVTLWGMP